VQHLGMQLEMCRERYVCLRFDRLCKQFGEKLPIDVAQDTRRTHLSEG